ncbi:MAG: hypothetical protein ACRDNS_08665, partial [Trebonia sp.]
PIRHAVERAHRREGVAVTGFADYPDPDVVDLPIVFLTVRDTVKDRLGGFQLGGDDLIKPFALASTLK